MQFESTRIIGIVQNNLLAIITSISCQLFIPPTDNQYIHKFQAQFADQLYSFIALFSCPNGNYCIRGGDYWLV